MGESKSCTTVFVADRTAMGCELLASALERQSQFRVLGWEREFAAAMSAVARLRPQVAVVALDLQDGPASGVSLISALHMGQPDTRAVLLLEATDRNTVIHAFRAGARGVLSRADGVAALRRCVLSVSGGQVWANTNDLNYLLESIMQPTAGPALSENCCKLLTRREREVVQLVADGLSNREIALHMKLSQHTVKNYLFQVFDKIGVSNRVELVLSALSAPVTDNPQNSRNRTDAELVTSMRHLPETMTNS